MRRIALSALLLLAAALALRAAQAPTRPPTSNAAPEAIRLNNLGVATMNQQKFEPALSYFEQALAADPGFVAARVNRAIALVSLQRYEPARGLLESVTQASPDHARAWYNLGLLHKSTGDSEAALAAFEKAAALRPGDAHAQYFVGLMAAQLQHYDRAIPAFQKALALDRFLVSAEFGLARAFQRAGKPEEAKTHLERFQRLTTEKIASAMSLTYGDQGPLSLAEAALPPAGAAPAPIEVTFAPTDAPAASAARPGDAGPGACVVDVDADGDTDIVRVGPTGARLLRNGGNGSFAAPAAIAAVPLAASAAGDFDNDEHPDLALGAPDGSVMLYRNDGKGAFTDATAATQLTSRKGHLAGVAFFDYDHDGDLDLFVPRSAGVGPAPGPVPPSHTSIWRNNGNGTFADVTAERGLGAPGRTIAVTASDIDNDRAIDLVFTGEPTNVFLNPRDGAFEPSQPWAGGMPAPTLGVAVLDFDKDGWMDLAFTHTAAPGVSLWKNDGQKGFTRVTLPEIEARSGAGVAVVDYDNDGWLDLVAVVARSGGDGLVVLRNEAGRYSDRTAATGLASRPLPNARAVVPADVDDDGDSDLVVTMASDGLTVLRNEGGNANHAVRLTLNGLADNRSGTGTKVEVQAGAIWQKFEATGGAGYLGQSAPAILAGIGSAQAADVVRLLWPTGVVQDEVDIAAGRRTPIEQVDRRGSSCPILFTWNGDGYEFITDAIGPAVIGHWVAPGERNVPDPNEYIRIGGRQLAAENGVLRVKFMEPMEEVVYLDQVRLLAVDHPEGSDVVPNEYFAATAPPPAARLFGLRDRRLPSGAWDDRGRDVLARLAEPDGRYVEGFAAAPFKGFAELHALELELGDLPEGRPVRLIMTGLTDYFTATSVFAAHQADLTPIVPWLEARLPDGSWRRVSDDIGFPAGLRRTMTADLTGRLPAGATRVRLWTNLKIYWDHILVDTTPDGDVPLRRHEAPLRAASLAFRGFPRETAGTIAADLRYVYDQVSRYGPWARHRGFYTRYGSVAPLAESVDDRFVIFGAGDEVSLEFDAKALPPLAPGWTRDYVFYVHGYVKDMDFYAAHAQTVTPLPFAAMGRYPYRAGVTYPARNRAYLLEWNTRHVDVESWPSYRAHYESEK